MTRYRCGSRAMRQNSAASSLNFGRLSASIIQPGEEKCEQERMNESFSHDGLGQK